LFDLLEEKFMPISDIKSRLDLKLETRNFEDVLDQLFVTGHLLRTGELNSFKYKSAHNFYCKSNKDNQIHLVNFMINSAKKMYEMTYILQNGEKKEKLPVFDEMYADPTLMYAFLRTMSTIQNTNFSTIVKQFDFSKFKKFVDVGGCLGLFSSKVKETHPAIECVNFDLPIVQVHFDNFMKEIKMENDAIKYQAGDFFKDDLPKTDLVAMGNILHDWGHVNKKILFKKAFDCLNENGAFLIVENFLDIEKKENTFALNVSVLMITECIEGFNMSIKEIEDYAKEAGFKKVENMSEKLGGVNLAICYK